MLENYLAPRIMLKRGQNYFQAVWGITMKLNSVRTIESLGMLTNENNDNNNNNNNSMLLNNSGPPAWILNLRDMDLDPPKLIRGNMEVIIWNRNTDTNTNADTNTNTDTNTDENTVLTFTLQVFLVCLYCLVCLSGLVTNLSLIWVRLEINANIMFPHIAQNYYQNKNKNNYHQVILGTKPSSSTSSLSLSPPGDPGQESPQNSKKSLHTQPRHLWPFNQVIILQSKAILTKMGQFWNLTHKKSLPCSVCP